ncbi:MAG TPA: hypothetical protein VFP09_11390 [Desertimonas sp.]|nr:hypothetical protein [Desertimonas sp.]
MANDYDITARNLMLDALAASCLRAALHTGDPGAANAADNEVTGGSPAYARKAITWAAASAGSMDETTSPVFDVPASTTVSWVSYWNTGGTVRYLKKNVTDEVFGAQGTYTLTDTDFDLNTA